MKSFNKQSLISHKLENKLVSNFFVRAIFIIVIFISLGLFINSFFLSMSASDNLQSSPSPETLGESKIVFSPSPSILPSPSLLPSPSASAKIIKSATPSARVSVIPSPKPSPNKSSYIIAIFGDSMVDTMGENLDYLDKSLKTRYPNTKFQFFNYGIGSQNVIEGNARFSSSFAYKTRNFSPINQINADIIIISTFAYNPLSPYDKNLYLANLKELINKAKSTNAQVYLLAEIAPLKTGFGKGAGGVNWDEEKTKTHVGYILSNLDGAIALASSINIPVINSYKKSQVDGRYGNRAYVGTHDGIHPSIEGEVFMAELIAETIKLP